MAQWERRRLNLMSPKLGGLDVVCAVASLLAKVSNVPVGASRTRGQGQQDE